MSAGERVDWGGDSWSGQNKRLAKSSFSGLLGKDKSPKSGKSNNKYTGFTVKDGGTTNQRTISGVSGLHKTLVDRKINTAKNKNKQVTSGGGLPPIARIQAKPAAVRVRPEN